jgi:hypothetical protein
LICIFFMISDVEHFLSFFIVAFLTGVRYFTVVLICIFFMISDVEHFLTYLLVFVYLLINIYSDHLPNNGYIFITNIEKSRIAFKIKHSLVKIGHSRNVFFHTISIFKVFQLK